MPDTFLQLYRQNLAEQGVDDPRDDYTISREVLGPLAEQNPAIFDAFPDFAQNYRAIREANAPSLGGEVGRGLKRGGLGLLSTGAGGLSLFTGDGWLREKARDLEQRAAAPELRATVPTLEDVAPGEEDTWRKVLSRDAVRYAAAKVGEAAPSIAEAVGTAAAGAVIGSAAAPGPGTIAGAAEGLLGRGLVRSAIQQLVRKGGTEEAIVAGLRAGTPEVVNAVATTAKNLAAIRGGTAVSALNSYLLNAGDVLSEVPDDPALAAGVGVISAIPDTVLPAVLLRRLFPGVALRVAQQEGRELVQRGAVDVAKKVGTALGVPISEAATEYFQEAVNVAARNIRDGRPIADFDDADLKRFREAAITGAAGGALAAPAVVMGGTPETVSTDVQQGAGAAPVSTPAPAVAPVVPAPPSAMSSAQILAAVDAMDDRTAAARLAELQTKIQRTQEEESEFQILLARAPATPAPPASQPESDYLYTVQQSQPHPATGEVVPGFVQIDAIVNGGRGDPLTDEQRAGLPQPPTWLPTGQYSLAQITEAIAKGPPHATEIPSSTPVPVGDRPQTGTEIRGPYPEGGAAPGAVEAQVEKPAAPVAPAEAAPAVAASVDLPKPAEIAPVVPSTTPTPEERAAVVATQTKPVGFSYGPIVEGGPTIDFREFEPIKASEWEKAIRANLRHPQAARGDKSGSRALTRVGMALQEPGGDGIIFAGVVVPQRIARVAGGIEIDGVALQSMGSGTKKRALEVDGGQPVLLREVVQAGYKPVAVVHFTGEPTKIFQRFANIAEFDQAYTASEKTSGRAGAGTVETPNAVPEVRRAIRGEQEIQAEIDRLGAEYQRATTDEQRDALSLEIVRRFDELNNVLHRGQNQTGDIALQGGVSRAPIDANRTQEFIAVIDRLRRQGANVELFTREFFAQDVRAEVEAQIAALRQREAQAPTPALKAALAREIARREQRLGEIEQARGAAFSPWHIALAVDDIQNATTGNLVTLLHESAEALAMRLNPTMRGRVARAIDGSLDELRKQAAEAAAKSGVPVAAEGGAFDRLAETLAQRLAAEGVPDAPSLARAIWQWVKDLYYRAAMALQRAFGSEPSDEMALDWFENQLRRVVGGDYDYRIARILDRYLPEPMIERVRRYRGRTGTPGGVSDYWNPYARTIQQPGVLPDTADGVGWNVEFQSFPTQRAGSQQIPGPEARARIDAAALNKLAEQMEGVRLATRPDVPWPQWWGVVGTGDDPRLMLAAMAQQFPGAETAVIGGDRMTQVMNDLASLEARRLMENVQAQAVQRLAKATEQIETESDRVIAAAKEVNRLEADRRNAQLQEAVLQEKLKTLVRRFVRDNSQGFKLAEQQGELAEAVRAAEGLIDGDPIPDRYQQVFKAVLDGDVPVFDYVRAIADLDLPLSDMTQREVVTAIRQNAEANETLKRLTANRPLLTALSVLARANAGQVDEIHLGWLRNAEQYRAIHEELQAIRAATDEELREMLANMDQRVKAEGLRERLKRDYLLRRRALTTARNRVADAQMRSEAMVSALPKIGEEVVRAQQTGSEAPSEWSPVDGAAFTEMVPSEDGSWRRTQRTLRFRPDGSAVDGEQLRKAIWKNNQWLQANAGKKGSALYERVLRQTTELGMLDLQAQYPAAQGFRIDKLLAPLVAEARQLGGAGSRIAQQLQQFQFIRFSHSQDVQTNAQAWSLAWARLKKATGISDNGILREQVYDPVSYFLNTEPGLDEEAAIREAVRMARARLPKPPAEGFAAAMEDLLRTSKTGFEYLVAQANQYGAFVRDPRLKSELRRAVAQGWLTSMRSVDAGLVLRITRDMERAGWRLARRNVEDARGRKRPEIVRAVTFEDLSAEDVANPEALSGALQRLFTPGIIRDWLVPFINKGGVEVFTHDGEAIPQIVLQNAWARSGGNVVAWIDAVGAEVGLDAPSEENADPSAEFRLSMLRQLDSLFGMEAKVAYEASQTRDMFDPLGPKPHVMMDARLNDTIPPEHLDFALLDPHTSQMLLGEIAFHAAFGRNGERMVQTLFELRQQADAMRQQYESLAGTTKNQRVAEAVARGWKYEDLERAAQRSKDIERFQTKLETFMSVNHPGGPFDQARAGMALVNFMAGQIVDNPKTGLYDWLSLFERPFAQRSLGPRSIRGSARALGTAAKTGLGSLLEALNLHILRASEYEREVAQAMGGSRNQPWAQAVADIGPGGRQALSDRVLIRPLGFLRYVQNKGVGSPAEARDFPRAAPVPGLGVNNWLGQLAAVGNVSSQLRELESMVRAGIDYFASHRDAAQDPSFRFKAKDLGLGRWDTGVFDWWRVKAVEYGLGTLEDMVRSTMPRATTGERLLSRDQVLRVAQMVSQELVGQSSINTMPSLLVTNPWLRTVFPLLRWPFWKMHQIHEGMRTADGRRDYASVARGLATLAMWNLPMGLAFTFLLDRYDEELLGRKSNLPNVGGAAALPFAGPVAEAIMADRSIPDTLKAYLVRSARAGNIYGLGSDLVGQIASPTDAQSGRRTFSLDQRVLVMSQFLNLQQALTNAVGQDWTATWASVWHPLFRSLGGNGAMHVLDVANKALGLDNAEARQVMRVNAQNWLRAAASELEIELRPGGSGTPTPMSVWTREMLTAAMANDRIGFMEAHRKALDAARKVVSSDPSVPAVDREREAESRVLAGWRGRDPLTIFARRPSEIEVRRMLGIMDPDGAQDVREALNRYAQFTRLISVQPLVAQQRAMERRLTRPPALANPFRRAMPAF